jgi:hypothetical protein
MIFPDARRIYSTIHNRIEKLWNFDPTKHQSNNLNILTGFICGIIQSKRCISLVVSIAYKGRALPLLWVTRKGKKGYFPEQMQSDPIKAVQEIIPKKTKVVILGDGEFDGAKTPTEI